ncbi:MEDS domain-containing protein [Cellulomonas sp. NS3]|uniref:MEDS domain-containing protein n=1 Tax=Cellulomonas sp. NS3 TaxID=2973977 RepID=UPI002161FBE4|nr:MEDS domain-containing protein [Cellulomonas sp. NS3]
MSQRVVTSVTGRSPGDHVCWPFHGIEEDVEAARAYVAEGLGCRERVAFLKVTSQSLGYATVSDVAEVGRPEGVRRPVRTELTAPSAQTGASSALLSSSALLQVDRMTRGAVEDGFTGLRLFTDVDDLVRDPDGRRHWIRSEHLIDRYALDNPLIVLCGYDVDDLGDRAVAEAARVHALTRGALSPFRLRADARAGLALVGDVDVASADALYDALLTIGPELRARTTVSVAELRFIDHAGLLALDRAARSLDVSVTLVDAEPLTCWLAATLGLRNVVTRAVS